MFLLFTLYKPLTQGLAFTDTRYYSTATSVLHGFGPDAVTPLMSYRDVYDVQDR